jgi:tetratricopeptide (TPR) repeat protein
MIGCKLNNSTLRENRTLSAYVNAYKGLNDRLKEGRISFCETSEMSLPDKLKNKFNTALRHYYKSTLNLNDCCKLMTEVYKAAPLNFDVAVNFANILRFSTQFDKALEIIKTLKSIRSGLLTPKYMKVRVLAESGKKDKAADYLKKVQNKYRIEDHLIADIKFMSYSFLSIGNRDQAFRVISKYLKLVPSDTKALTHFIYINLLKENYNFVMDTAEKYLLTTPDDISIMFHLAKAYTRTNKKELAVAVYERIAKFSFDKSIKAKALYESAINRDNAVEFEVVIEKLKESYKLDPKEEADGYLAALYAEKKMFDEAEKWINTCATRVNIMDDNVYLGIKVMIQENKGLYDEAVASYIRLAEIDGANSMHYNNRIDLLLQKQMITNS